MDQDYQIMQLMAQRDDAPPPPTAATSLAAAADQDVEQLLRGRQDVMYVVVLTKADKLKRGAAKNTLLRVQKELQDETLVRVELFSAHNGTGIDRARDQLSQWFAEEAATENERPEPGDQ